MIEIRAHVTDPAVAPRIRAVGSEPAPGNPDDFKAFVSSDLNRRNNVVAEAEIERILTGGTTGGKKGSISPVLAQTKESRMSALAQLLGLSRRRPDKPSLLTSTLPKDWARGNTVSASR